MYLTLQTVGMPGRPASNLSEEKGMEKGGENVSGGDQKLLYYIPVRFLLYL